MILEIKKRKQQVTLKKKKKVLQSNNISIIYFKNFMINTRVMNTTNSYNNMTPLSWLIQILYNRLSIFKLLGLSLGDRFQQILWSWNPQYDYYYYAYRE